MILKDLHLQLFLTSNFKPKIVLFYSISVYKYVIEHFKVFIYDDDENKNINKLFSFKSLNSKALLLI